jgi:hypothetical protein
VIGCIDGDPGSLPWSDTSPPAREGDEGAEGRAGNGVGIGGRGFDGGAVGGGRLLELMSVRLLRSEDEGRGTMSDFIDIEDRRFKASSSETALLLSINMVETDLYEPDLESLAIFD